MQFTGTVLIYDCPRFAKSVVSIVVSIAVSIVVSPSSIFSVLVLALSLNGCVDNLHSQSPAPKWTNGFWFWQGSSPEVTAAGPPLDVLYVHVGAIAKNLYGPIPASWSAYSHLPHELPEAREYWMVYRYERQGVPPPAAASTLTAEFGRMLLEAQQRHLKVAGLQLDIDSPTAMLADYAQFLAEVRAHLPKGARLSITGLLDWFRDGTQVSQVIDQVDDFVPQFYDLNMSQAYGPEAAIASTVNPATWAPRFNRLGKPYRIGISTFGRAIAPDLAYQSGGGFVGLAFARDVLPLDAARNPDFALTTKRNPANEIILTYRAQRKTRIGSQTFAPGSSLQFIIPTTGSISAAVSAARQFHGNCAGVVFFRWPAPEETLSMRPDEVLAGAGLAPVVPRTPAAIHAFDGSCATVNCADLFLANSNPLSPAPVHYRIHSSAELEYFLPERNLPVRMTGPHELELSLPPWCGRAHMFLGRAVTKAKSEYTVTADRQTPGDHQ